MISDRDTSRRQILKSVAGMLPALGGSWGGGQLISPPTDISRQSMDQRTSTNLIHPQKGKRIAYVTLPGLSGVALLANLPYLLNISTGPQPVVFMDIYDYHRIGNWSLESDDTWIRDGAVAYGQMLQRGAIQPIDYGHFYPKHIQQENLQRNQTILSEVSDERQQEIAADGSKGSLKYNLGTYQKPILSNLGEDIDGFKKARRNEKKRRQKLDRGGGMPNAWNERVTNQYVASLTVRKNVDNITNLAVKYVLGEGETGIFEEFLATARKQKPMPFYLRRLGDDDFELEDHIIDLARQEFAPTRESLDEVAEIAAKMEGIQQSEWNIFGTTLGTPQYSHVFNISNIQSQMDGEVNEKALRQEAASIINALEKRTANEPTSSHIRYVAEHVGEEIPSSQIQDGDLQESLGYAARLCQYSNELDSLIHEGGVSEPAALIAASVVSNPSAHHNEGTVFQQTEKMIRRFNPPSQEESQLMAFRRRYDNWRNSPDWYLSHDRSR
jgi:hypothetical protein